MPLTPEEQAKFDRLAKAIGDELVIQVLAIRRPMTTEVEVRVVADLVADEVWGAIDPVLRTGRPPMSGLDPARLNRLADLVASRTYN